MCMQAGVGSEGREREREHMRTGSVVGDPRTICTRVAHWTWQSTLEPSPTALVAIVSLVWSGTFNIKGFIVILGDISSATNSSHAVSPEYRSLV